MNPGQGSAASVRRRRPPIGKSPGSNHQRRRLEIRAAVPADRSTARRFPGILSTLARLVDRKDEPASCGAWRASRTSGVLPTAKTPDGGKSFTQPGDGRLHDTPNGGPERSTACPSIERGVAGGEPQRSGLAKNAVTPARRACRARSFKRGAGGRQPKG